MIGCEFYMSPVGNVPVREWLKSLSRESNKEIGSNIKTIQETWPIGKPLVGAFGNGLYEVRSTSGSNEYRVLFCFHKGKLILLHGFQKKSQKTPDNVVNLARNRKKELK
jgi:phage-related protein